MLRYYYFSGLWWNGQGTQNNTPIEEEHVLEDFLEPYVLVAYRAFLSGNQWTWATNVLDKNGNFADTGPSIFNSQTWTWTPPNAARFGGTEGLVITRGDVVPDGYAPPNSRWSCVDGQCRVVFQGVFSSLEECRQHCRPLGGRCNCPPPSVCLSELEYQRLVRKLSLLRRVLTG